MYELDWRLVTSQMYQESRFDPGARTWAGAPGVDAGDATDGSGARRRRRAAAEQGIHAGVKLLARYAAMYREPEIDEPDLRFALAASNCGPGPVADGGQVAADLKLDPTRWFDHVEKAMPPLANPRFARAARHGYCRCGGPMKYVSGIQSRYESYSKLIALH